MAEYLGLGEHDAFAAPSMSVYLGQSATSLALGSHLFYSASDILI